MSASSFEVSRSVDAIFECNGPIVQFYFNMNGQQAGRVFAFSRTEAADLGKKIASTGEWAEFPINGVPIEGVKAFGERLRVYGVSGC